MEYKVTDVSKTIGMDKKGKFTDIYEVTYETIDGFESTIEIPFDAFTKENVKEAIENNLIGDFDDPHYHNIKLMKKLQVA